MESPDHRTRNNESSPADVVRIEERRKLLRDPVSDPDC